jgi:serine/threonine protein kinase
MEYASGGTLQNLLEQAGVFTVERAKFYAAEIALALEHISWTNGLENRGLLRKITDMEQVIRGMIIKFGD